MTNFVANMELPEEYIIALQRIAEESNMTADQLARNIVANFIKKTYPFLLTNKSN